MPVMLLLENPAESVEKFKSNANFTPEKHFVKTFLSVHVSLLQATVDLY